MANNSKFVINAMQRNA